MLALQPLLRHFHFAASACLGPRLVPCPGTQPSPSPLQDRPIIPLSELLWLVAYVRIICGWSVLCNHPCAWSHAPRIITARRALPPGVQIQTLPPLGIDLPCAVPRTHRPTPAPRLSPSANHGTDNGLRAPCLPPRGLRRRGYSRRMCLCRAQQHLRPHLPRRPYLLLRRLPPLQPESQPPDEGPVREDGAAGPDQAPAAGEGWEARRGLLRRCLGRFRCVTYDAPSCLIHAAC